MGEDQATQAEVVSLRAQLEEVTAALLVAADDLDKAANQFAGLTTAPHLATYGANVDKFAAKAKRARGAALPERRND